MIVTLPMKINNVINKNNIIVYLLEQEDPQYIKINN